MGCTSSDFDKDTKIEEEMKKERINNINKNTEIENEKPFQSQNKNISDKNRKNILEQMKRSICQIKTDNGRKGSGFLCRIQITNKYDLLSVLITNNSLLGQDSILPGKKIKLFTNKKSKVIVMDDSRETFTSQKDNITIIELKNSDKLNEN